jgi:hypothetical protein
MVLGGNEKGAPWSPWRHLRQRHPGVRVKETELPCGVLGCIDHYQKIIWLDSRLLSREQRATLAHEIGHLELDHFMHGKWISAPEWKVDRWAARRLIPFVDLLRAFQWSDDLEEMAEELWVDRHTLGTRLRCLTDDEQDQVMKAIERRRAAA